SLCCLLSSGRAERLRLRPSAATTGLETLVASRDGDDGRTGGIAVGDDVSELIAEAVEPRGVARTESVAGRRRCGHLPLPHSAQRSWRCAVLQLRRSLRTLQDARDLAHKQSGLRTCAGLEQLRAAQQAALAQTA